MSRFNGFNSFNDNFNQNSRTIKRVGAAIGCLWVLFFLVSLGVLGGLAYVAFHFLAKVW